LEFFPVVGANKGIMVFFRACGIDLEGKGYAIGGDNQQTPPGGCTAVKESFES